MCDVFCFSKNEKGIILMRRRKHKHKEGYMGMTVEGRERLVQENQKLKEEKELLLQTVEQLNKTINRLISRYITKEADC